MIKLIIYFVILGIFSVFVPSHVQAHEVYVLNSAQIPTDLRNHSINVFSSLASNGIIFLLFAALAIVSLFLSFILSFSYWGCFVTKYIEKYQFLAYPFIRIVFGIAILSSAYHSSVFGPELPFSQLPGGVYWTLILIVCGIMVLLGFYTRYVAVLLFLFFCAGIYAFHWYMITYINYLGEIFVLFLIGGDEYSVDSVIFTSKYFFEIEKAKIYILPILRLTFGMSLLYAAIYVKFVHPALTYQVIMQYHLIKFFPFDPVFTILGAGCVEVVIALIFLLGINMRWNILFFLLWVTLSLLYFGESVWPHFILYGIAIGIFFLGYDKYTSESWCVKQTKKYLKLK